MKREGIYRGTGEASRLLEIGVMMCMKGEEGRKGGVLEIICKKKSVIIRKKSVRKDRNVIGRKYMKKSVRKKRSVRKDRNVIARKYMKKRVIRRRKNGRSVRKYRSVISRKCKKKRRWSLITVIGGRERESDIMVVGRKDWRRLVVNERCRDW